MQTKSYTLRKRPKFEFVFEENEFEIIDIKGKNENSVYRYALIEKVEIKKGKVSWLATILSFVVEFFITGSSFGKV